MAQFRPQAQFNSEGRILITLTLPSPHRGISANLEVFPLIPPWYKDQKGKGSNLVAVVFLSFFLLLFLSLQSTGGCG